MDDVNLDNVMEELAESAKSKESDQQNGRGESAPKKRRGKRKNRQKLPSRTTDPAQGAASVDDSSAYNQAQSGVPLETLCQHPAADRPGIKGKGIGRCAIKICNMASSNHDHKCHGEGCSNYVHNLCTQAAGLGGDGLVFYCSYTCKDSKNKSKDSSKNKS